VCTRTAAPQRRPVAVIRPEGDRPALHTSVETSKYRVPEALRTEWRQSGWGILAKQRDAESMREPDGYVELTASAKSQWLWSKLIQETAHRPTTLPRQETPFRQALLREASIVVRRSELSKALTRTSDLMEPG